MALTSVEFTVVTDNFTYEFIYNASKDQKKAFKGYVNVARFLNEEFYDKYPFLVKRNKETGEYYAEEPSTKAGNKDAKGEDKYYKDFIIPKALRDFINDELNKELQKQPQPNTIKQKAPAQEV